MILTNPVVLAVLALCIPCLLKVNVMLSMMIAIFVGGISGGLGIDGTLSGLYGGPAVMVKRRLPMCCC